MTTFLHSVSTCCWTSFFKCISFKSTYCFDDKCLMWFSNVFALMSEWFEGQQRPEYQAISDLMIVSELGTTDMCPECIRGDYRDSTVTWEFYCGHDSWLPVWQWYSHRNNPSGDLIISTLIYTGEKYCTVQGKGCHLRHRHCSSVKAVWIELTLRDTQNHRELPSLFVNAFLYIYLPL